VAPLNERIAKLAVTALGEQIRHAQEIATLRQQNADLSDALSLANETISRMSRCMTASDLQRAREAGDIDT
jgi:hypothetical protein